MKHCGKLYGLEYNDPSALPFREQLADYVFCSPARSVIWKGKGRPLYQKGRSLNVEKKKILIV